jgi:uncharacterized protein with ACT and thioredoxin-like domain
MVPAIHRNHRMDSQDLVGPIFHPIVSLPMFSSITSVAEEVVKLVLRSEALHVLIVCDKVLLFTLFNKSRPVFF